MRLAGKEQRSQGREMPSAAYYLTMAAECRELSDRTRESHAAETLRKRARDYTDRARALDPNMVDRDRAVTPTTAHCRSVRG